MSAANKIGHIEGIVVVVAGNAETCRNMLAGIRALVGIAGKGCPAAGDIDHLSLRKYLVKIFRKPYRPVVSQACFTASFCARRHIDSPYKRMSFVESTFLLCRFSPKEQENHAQ